jgi:predicted esterase
MTRDDRLHEIADHIGFLNQLADTVLADSPGDVRITVLGFSQGTATVGRWLAQARFRPAHLILWAGGFPDDLPPAHVRTLLQDLPLTIVVGIDDEFISAAQAAQQQQWLQQHGSAPALIRFAGKHELNRAVLAELAAQLRS